MEFPKISEIKPINEKRKTPIVFLDLYDSTLNKYVKVPVL